MNDSKIEFAREICQHLANYEPDGPRCGDTVSFRLVHTSDDGRGIWVNTQKAKYEVSCDWPHHNGSWFAPANQPRIGVSKDRGAQVLAHEITRRLLPGYHEEYPSAQRSKQTWVDHDKGQLALRAEMLEAIDPSRPIPNHQAESMHLSVYALGLRKLMISGDTVAFETSYLPKEVARKVIDLLREAGVE